MSSFAESLRISRVTLFSLLLALLLAAGIALRNAWQKDECSRYLAGDRSAPATQTVLSGTRAIEVPCTDWIDRQPQTVLLLCLVDVALFVIFALNAAADVRAWMQRRRQMERVS
jgi:hypothetical protein